MADFVARKGSTNRSITATLDSTNPLDDFSTVTAVVFYMRKSRATVNKINGAAAVVVSSTTAAVVVRYDWAAADVDTAGDYEGYWKATFANTKTDRFPADDSGKYNTIKILGSFE